MAALRKAEGSRLTLKGLAFTVPRPNHLPACDTEYVILSRPCSESVMQDELKIGGEKSHKPQEVQSRSISVA